MCASEIELISVYACGADCGAFAEFHKSDMLFAIGGPPDAFEVQSKR